MKAGPTTTNSRNEEHGRRIKTTKQMVSEPRATLICKGRLEIGQQHTEESRARTTFEMEQEPSPAKRLEENTTMRLELVRQTPDDVLPVEAATAVPKLAGKDAVVVHQSQTS